MCQDHALLMWQQPSWGKKLRRLIVRAAPFLAWYDVCVDASVNTISPRRIEMNSRVDINETFLTVAEVAERLKVNEETARRLFLNEPGVIVICYPRKGVRVYRTLRIPESVYLRVVTRFIKTAA